MDNPLSKIDRLQQLLADELRQPLRDAAGIIIPQGVDAAHRAAGMRRIIATIKTEHNEVTPCQKQP